MRIERVVADASPLIILFKSGFADLLPRLFPVVLVTEQVFAEVMEGGDAGPDTDVAVLGLTAASWVTRIEVPVIPDLIAAWDLGVGESSVLAHSLVTPGARAMLDDRAARVCASALGVRTIGTAGVLLLAKKRGLLDSVGDALKRVIDCGCWLSEDIVKSVLVEAGENG